MRFLVKILTIRFSVKKFSALVTSKNENFNGMLDRLSINAALFI
ncbi:hypothetical protein PRO82_000048 [Candidatus Protochlamydia amoebophila]|nr:hypothetical protein [Candidatus Protochlamydia amoebophila]